MLLKNTNKLLKYNGSLLNSTQPTPPWEEVKIGTQTWMAKNLEYDDGLGGILISSYNLNGLDVTAYYYHPSAVKRIEEHFNGWRVPNKNDFYTLFSNFGSTASRQPETFFGDEMKDIMSVSGWNQPRSL